jgi:acetylglutamate kinase
MKILVKLGGTLLDEPASRNGLARQLAAATAEHDLVVVHGGGKQMTRYLAERGIDSRFVDGLRVSDEAVIDAASKVIAGSVNKQFVAALTAAGRLAVGLSGIDGQLTTAIRMDGNLGFVGSPVRSDGRLLRLLVDGGYLPVVACLAADEKGTIYNVNADSMATSCALAFGAQELLFLTDVTGVRDGKGRVLDRMLAGEIAGLIESGVAYGGMQAKLAAASIALAGGVKEVTIASGHEPEICRRILQGAQVGTRLGE